MTRERLDYRQIGILRTLAQRGLGRPITLLSDERGPALPLWRRNLVEIWYRRSPDTSPSSQGPYYALTVAGFRLASHFLPLETFNIQGGS